MRKRRTFTEHPDVDTLICATDTMAVEQIKLKENRYQIPQQVQIAGMETVSGKIIEPKLTTVFL